MAEIKAKTHFIEDFHAAPDFYPWQIDQLKRIQPDTVFLEMLPSEKRFENACQKLTKGDIDPQEFKEKTNWEKHWGTFEGYNLLFSYLHNLNIRLQPIDQPLKDRKKLCRREKRIISDSRARKDTQQLVNQSRIELFLVREAIFARNILNFYQTTGFEKAAIIVGHNHVTRLAYFFNFLDEFEAEEVFIGEKITKELYPKFKERHLKFAEKHNILKMDAPPLVPINILRFA